MPLRRIFLNPVTLLATLHIYVAWRLLPALPGHPLLQSTVVVLLLLSVGLIPLSMTTRNMRDERIADRLAWAGFLVMGLFSSLFVLTLLRDTVLLLALPLMHTKLGWLSQASAPFVIGGAVAASAAGLHTARRVARVQEVTIPIRNLPDSLHGFSIVQISDIHVGATIKREFVAAIVERVNGLNADLVAVTGDVVDGSVAQLSGHTEPLSQLKARHGAFFVTGNHEYYSGEPAWSAEFRRIGLKVLKNEHVVLAHADASLVIAGVTDVSSHHFDPTQNSDPAVALAGAPADAHVKLLLAHRPSSAEAAHRAGFDLQLSGHTHGGQFWPWNHFVRFFNPFTAGLHRLNDLWVYVNRGTGYWGPPKRFGVPPEITRIRLARAGGQVGAVTNAFM
jgi:predicted MPP superfamily phosphohydrolase